MTTSLIAELVSACVFICGGAETISLFSNYTPFFLAKTLPLR